MLDTRGWKIRLYFLAWFSKSRELKEAGREAEMTALVCVWMVLFTAIG